MAEGRPHARTPAPLTLLDGLDSTDCFTTPGGDQLIAWRSSSAPCPPTISGGGPETPIGAEIEIAAITIDADGRLATVRVTTLVPSDVPGNGTSVTMHFWYDGVPEVSAAPEE